MNLLVLSDLHIDNGDRFGTFGWKPKRFIRFLNQFIYENRVDQVVLNGDIYDLYKYDFKEIYSKNFELISYFNRRGFIYTRGNHDLFNPFAKDWHEVENSKGQVIHIEHGHNADFMNGTRIGRAIGKAFFNLLKKMVKISWIERLYFRVVEYDDEVNRVPKKYNTYKYLKYALRLLSKHDMVVLGHTHKLETHKTYFLSSKKAYLNSGTCSLGRFQALLIDTETLNYETIKIGKSETKQSIRIKEKEKRGEMLVSA